MNLVALVGFTTALLGFVLGFALARANSCTVAATRRLVVEHRPDWLFGLLIASSWAGVVLLGLASLSPDRFHLPAALPLGWTLVFGSVMIGVGALLNGGCFLGSVALLGRGNLNYLLTLFGIAAALALPVHWVTTDMSAITPNGSLDGFVRLAFLGAFAIVATYSLLMLRRRRRSAVFALLVVGLSGGSIYALNPDWSYLAVIDHAVNSQNEDRSWMLEAGAIALFLGATISAMLRHQFALTPLSPAAATRCLAGGLCMGIGARLVPGGNDTLMLWSIPGLARYGFVSYAIMIGTIASLLSVGRLWRFPGRAQV